MVSPGMLGFQKREDFRGTEAKKLSCLPISLIELLHEIFPQMFQGTLHGRLKHFATIGNQDFCDVPTHGPLLVNQP